MVEAMLDSAAPWEKAADECFRMGSGSAPLLVVGPPSRLVVDCVKEIHDRAGGGPFEWVICSPDSTALEMLVFGNVDSFAGVHLHEWEHPNSAVQRSAGGTLFLDCIDRCNPSDAEWIQILLARQPLTIRGYTTELDSTTRVIVAIRETWITEALMERRQYPIPQWLVGLLERRVVVLQPLQGRAKDISGAIDWLFKSAANAQGSGGILSREAKDLLLSRQWPGDYDQLRDTIGMVVTAALGRTITVGICERVLESYQNPGMGSLDNYRRQECYDYCHGLSYMGRPVASSDIYQWVEQFARLAPDEQFDPWQVGLRMMKAIHDRYFYSSDRIRILLRNAYSSFCDELGKSEYNDYETGGNAESGFPRLGAMLVNPLGPLKSSSGVLPYIAHLVAADSKHPSVIPIEEIAEYLHANESMRVVLFCDDFAGTGQQIVAHLIERMVADEALKSVCERRQEEGRPLTLGVALAVSFDSALTRIRKAGPSWLPILAHAGEVLGEQDRVFSDCSSVFPEAELRTWAKALVIDEVGGCLLPKWPGGFGNVQALVVTADNCPNDTLPAICMTGMVQAMTWKPLFKRASSPLT